MSQNTLSDPLCNLRQILRYFPRILLKKVNWNCNFFAADRKFAFICAWFWQGLCLDDRFRQNCALTRRPKYRPQNSMGGGKPWRWLPHRDRQSHLYFYSTCDQAGELTSYYYFLLFFIYWSISMLFVIVPMDYFFIFAYFNYQTILSEGWLIRGYY